MKILDILNDQHGPTCIKEAKMITMEKTNKN